MPTLRIEDIVEITDLENESIFESYGTNLEKLDNLEAPADFVKDVLRQPGNKINWHVQDPSWAAKLAAKFIAAEASKN